MRTGKRFGLMAFSCGVSSCILFAGLLHVSRLGIIVGGVLLGFFDKLGFVSHEPQQFAEWKSSSVFSLNDANVILWLTWLAFASAFAAIFFALMAERKREDTLYLGAGFIIATIGIGLLYPMVMLASQAAGALVLGFIRRRSAIQI